MKLYEDCYRTTTTLVPELNRRDPLTNKVIEVYTNAEVKITELEDFNLSCTKEPTFNFTLCISNGSNLDFNSSFKFDYFVDGIHIELLKCKVDLILAKTVELSCTYNKITGFDLKEDLFTQLAALYI